MNNIGEKDIVMKPDDYHVRKKALPGSSNVVYFSSIKKEKNNSRCFKNLLDRIDPYIPEFRENSFVGIKMTVGDEGSTGYINPELVRILVEDLRERGTKPFVFDTNVIYTGQRRNAIDHLNLAYRKGFTPDNLGCPYIIADSVFGTDSRILKADFKNIKEIRVPSLVGVLEDLVVLTHITGHIMSGYAGSIKNVAMGMASRAGKQVQHSSLKPAVNVDGCTLCGCCIEMCPVSAISEKEDTAFINSKKCIGCGECISACKFNAVTINWHEDVNIFVERMAEYACGILSQIKKKVFFNFAFDVTEECDCISGDDTRIVQDTGVFASKDILAVDKACFDMLSGNRDIFSRNGKITAHRHQFKYAEKIGLGSLNYKLIEL